MHFLEWQYLNCDKKLSLKFVFKGPINNIPALVQIVVWRQPGEKPSSDQIVVVSVVSLLTHICVTQPHSINIPRCNKLSPYMKVTLYICQTLIIFQYLYPTKIPNWICGNNWRDFARVIISRLTFLPNAGFIGVSIISVSHIFVYLNM